MRNNRNAMVTIYVESRTVRFRMPVLSLGRWSGALFVRLQDRCEDQLDLLAQAHATRRVGPPGAPRSHPQETVTASR